MLTCGSGRAANGLLTLASGQTANGDSANWLRVGVGLHALAVQYVIAPTATVEMFQSLDGGATFTDVNVPDTASTATDGHTIENPIGIYKATVTNFSGGSVTVTARCGASAGGRP